MTQEQLNTLSELLADFKSEYTDIDNDDYWNVEEVEGLVDSAISDNNHKKAKATEISQSSNISAQ